MMRKDAHWTLFLTITLIVAGALAVTLLSWDTCKASEDRVIRTLSIISRPQSVAPNEFETCKLLSAEMKKIGLTTKIKIMPWEQMMNQVWYKRNEWDMTGWLMTARPERLDPDEFTFNLFHSSTAKNGYNFVGYKNPEYDKLAEAQRVTPDKEKRKQLIFKAQEIIARDAAYNFCVNQKLNYVYNNQVFAPDSIKDMAGMGIKNFWTYIEAKPIGNQKDFILNHSDAFKSCNPLYISGTVDSWVTELLWDRVMRVGLDGLPKPWAAESVKWLSDSEVEVIMRKGMKWHDGQPLTVEDVKFSFEAPMTGESPMYKPFVTNIDGIDIIDDRTLVFKLKKPSAAFETSTLAKLNLIPKHIWGPILEELKDNPDTAESRQEEHPIGSGPFKFAHIKFSEEAMLLANKDHFHPPKVDRWIIRIIPNMEATLGMIANGEINFLSLYLGDPELLAQKVKADHKLTMVSSIDLGFRFVGLNHRRPPFGDVAFRRAIAALTDRQFIVDAFWKGFAVQSDSIISPALAFWNNPKLDFPSGGLEVSEKILKDAGYEWDKRGRLMYPLGQKETLKPLF